MHTACYKRKRKQGKTVDIRADYGEIFKMLCTEMMTDKQIMMYSPYLVDIHFSFISLQLSV